MAPRDPASFEEAVEQLELVTALARRIHRDLCHAVEDIPEAHPVWQLMKQRCDFFAAALGDTSEYRHELHLTILRLSAEVQALRQENATLRKPR